VTPFIKSILEAVRNGSPDSTLGETRVYFNETTTRLQTAADIALALNEPLVIAGSPAPKEPPPQEDARHVCDNHCGGTPGTLDACDLCGAEVQHHTLIHDDGHMHCLDCTPPAPKETPRRPGSLDMRDGFGMCAAPKGDKP
jgi:hypothetical protein